MSMLCSMRRYKFLSLLLFGALFVGNAYFWFQIRYHEANENYLYIPDVPKAWQHKVFSLGDDQFFYRVSALRMQNFADPLGKLSGLIDYDFDRLRKWLFFLSDLDGRSHLTPSVAAYYYGGAPDKEKKLKIAHYLEEYASEDLEKRWWWMTQAIYLASESKNFNYAMQIARKFENFIFSSDDIPKWVKFLPAIYTAKAGEKEKAFHMLQLLYKNRDDLSDYDLNYMNYFIKKHLAELRLDHEFQAK